MLYKILLKVKPQLHTFTILATIPHDSSRFGLEGKVGVHRNGKKKIQHQYSVSWCSYSVSIIHLQIHYDSWRQRCPKSSRFFTNHYGTTTIHTDVSTVLLQIMPMHPDVNHSYRGQNRECVTGAKQQWYGYIRKETRHHANTKVQTEH